MSRRTGEVSRVDLATYVMSKPVLHDRAGASTSEEPAGGGGVGYSRPLQRAALG